MLLYQETSPLFTQSVTHTAAPIHGRHEPFGGRRPETLGSFSCLWHVFRRQTRTESFVLKDVGSKLIHHLKRTPTAWALKMPCLLNQNLHRATFKRSFSFSGQNSMRPVGILWGTKMAGRQPGSGVSLQQKKKAAASVYYKMSSMGSFEDGRVKLS